MRGTNAGETPGHDLAALGDEALQQANIAVGNGIDLLGAELADLFAAEELTAATGATGRSRSACGAAAASGVGAGLAASLPRGQRVRRFRAPLLGFRQPCLIPFLNTSPGFPGIAVSSLVRLKPASFQPGRRECLCLRGGFGGFRSGNAGHRSRLGCGDGRGRWLGLLRGRGVVHRLGAALACAWRGWRVTLARRFSSSSMRTVMNLITGSVTRRRRSSSATTTPLASMVSRT